VLWLGGDVEPWVLMGRASWSAKVQGAGVVFSRPLALEIRDRARRLTEAGLVGQDFERPLTVPARRPPSPERKRVEAFCAAPDAPAWIIWPRWSDAPPPESALAAHDWTPGAPFVNDLLELDAKRAPRADRYAVIPCAGE
jgi:hypothetical protein